MKKIAMILMLSIACTILAYAVQQGQGKNDRFDQAYDDIQGVIATALTGVTQYTFRQYRTTGMVYPHVANNDIFAMTFQMPHRKKLSSNIASIHIHYIPIASDTGVVTLNTYYGFYNAEASTIPAILPSVSTTTINITPSDQYVLNYATITLNIAYPNPEGYSSILMSKTTRTDVGDSYSGEIAIVYMDAHIQVDRKGSYNELSD